MSGPMVMLGTKWPSMTSTWIQSQPAASMARTSSPSRAKSAERIDGAMMMSRAIFQCLSALPRLLGQPAITAFADTLSMDDYWIPAFAGMTS